MHRTLTIFAFCAAMAFAQQNTPPAAAKPTAGAPARAAEPKTAPLDELTGTKVDNLQLKAQLTQSTIQNAQQALQQLGKDFDALVSTACAKAALPAPCKVDKDAAGSWILVGNTPAPPPAK